MTDYGNNNQKQAPYTYANVPPRGNETALMIEGLYNGIAYDLQKMKKELMNELKYSAMQSSSVYQSIQKETSSAVETNAQTAQSVVRELKYGYQQNQMIFESLSSILKEDVLEKLETMEGKAELLEQIDKALAEIGGKLEELASMVKTMALCGLGKSAPLPVISTLSTFRDEYVEHIVDKKCRAKACTALRRYVINPAYCKGCGKCARNCPVNAISGKVKLPYHIDPAVCIKCGACKENCAFDAIYIEA